MADTRFGNFQQLMQGKKPMTAKEAWLMLNELGLLAQEFVPGATSVRKLLEGKPMEALYDLQDWIPGNAAWQNFINGRDQDWVRNSVDAMSIANPLTKGVSKVMRAVEKVPKGPKDGFVQAVFLPKQGNKGILVKPTNATELEQFNEAIDLAVKKGQIPKTDGAKMKFNAESDIKQQQTIQRAIDSGTMDPYSVETPINVLKQESVSPSDIGKHDKAKNVGLKYKVTEYPSGVTRQGNKYYTTGEGGNQLLYSENTVDASNARHAFTDYNKKWPLAMNELKKQLPNPRNPDYYMPIRDKYGKYINPYKTVTEPAMLKGKLPYRSEEAANMSIQEGKRALQSNPLYMSTDDFLKYMFGLEP